MSFRQDLSGKYMIKMLGRLGYATTRQAGSHIRLTTFQNGTHHVTIPNHSPLKLGTLDNKRCKSTFWQEQGSDLGDHQQEIIKTLMFIFGVCDYKKFLIN